MSEIRRTKIVDEELEDFSSDEEQSFESIRDELFWHLKQKLHAQERLLGKLYYYANQHNEFDYDDMGVDFEGEQDIKRRCETLKEKICNGLGEELDLKLGETKIDTLHMMITTHINYKEEDFKVLIEVFEDSFALELA